MNKNTSMTEQSSAMNEDIEFIMEQAEIIAKNGNVVMAYSEVIDENMFNIPSEKKYQAKMDAAKLIENGKRMQKLAEKRKEDALSRVTDEDVEAETIEYLDIIIDNANTIVASGELLQARIQ